MTIETDNGNLEKKTLRTYLLFYIEHMSCTLCESTRISRNSETQPIEKMNSGHHHWETHQQIHRIAFSFFKKQILIIGKFQKRRKSISSA